MFKYPNDVLIDGDLMLFDLGSQYQNYCADVSRTLPINGKFNDFQLKLYIKHNTLSTKNTRVKRVFPDPHQYS